ncbi:MAG: hypothetical protein WA323_00525 [Candidatus Nitrosopolaris sp.]
MNNTVKKISVFAFVAIATASLLASDPILKNQPVLAANLCGSGLNCGSSSTVHGTSSTIHVHGTSSTIHVHGTTIH